MIKCGHQAEKFNYREVPFDLFGNQEVTDLTFKLERTFKCDNMRMESYGINTFGKESLEKVL